jgi:hypothetical protein
MSDHPEHAPETTTASTVVASSDGHALLGELTLTITLLDPEDPRKDGDVVFAGRNMGREKFCHLLEVMAAERRRSG